MSNIQLERKNNNLFLYIAICFVTVLLISNTVAVKIVQIGKFSLTGATFIFPISYIFGDILTEVYGYKASRKVIWVGFLALIFMSLIYWLVQLLPAAPFWHDQQAYELILGVVPRIVLGSIVGYFAGEFSNSYVLSKMKIWTNGRYLWTRTIGSTVVGEAVDSFLFVFIAFIENISLSGLIAMAVSIYIIKVIYEVLVTPVTYLIVGKLKRLEGINVYDRGVNYNPFKLQD
ncbi:MAG: queuosine precursor transporter [Patescibacteria group bacterium]